MKYENGILEKMGIIFNKYTCFNIVLKIRYKEIIIKQRLKSALREIQKKYLYLNGTINDNLEFIEFEQYQEIPIWCYTITEETQIQDFEDALLNSKFEKDQVLLRVILLNSENKSTMLISSPHYISDGMSMLNFIQDLFLVYNNLQFEKNNFEMKRFVLNSSFVDNADNDYSCLLFEEKKNDLHNEVVDYHLRRSAILQFELSKEESRKFIYKCKKTNHTIQSCLSALASNALAKLIFSECKIETITIDNLTAIDLRKETNDNNYNLGMGAMFVKTSQVSIDRNYTYKIGEMAMTISCGINRMKDADAYYKLIRIIGNRLSLPEKEFLDLMQFTRPFVFVSNIGNIKCPCDDKVEKIMGEPTIHYIQGTKWGIGMTVGCFKGNLFFNLVYTKPYWTALEAEVFKENLISEIDKFITE